MYPDRAAEKELPGLGAFRSVDCADGHTLLCMRNSPSLANILEYAFCELLSFRFVAHIVSQRDLEERNCLPN